MELTRAERERNVRDAIASGRLEGFEPSEDTLRWSQEYIDGTLTIDEWLLRVKAKYGILDA